MHYKLPNQSVDFSKPVKAVKEKKKYKIRPLSVKRSRQNREYLAIRKEFLKDKICPITLRPATEIHHMKGRIGDLLTDTRYFLAVTRKGHNWIHNNVTEAKEKGYIL